MIMKENKIIAEFMGYETYEGVDKVCINLTENNGFSSDWGHVPTKYHTSWDWLMPVVEKIESFQDGEDGDSMRGHLYNFRIEQYFVYILDGESMDVIIEMNGDSKIDATYKAVVEFINQYNK